MPAGGAESFLSFAAGAWIFARGGVTPQGQAMVAFQDLRRRRELGLGQDTEARVVRSQARGWEAPVSIELVAVLSVQDPPGARRMERAEAWRQLSAWEMERSWGGVRPLQARQGMGSRWAAQEASGVSPYRLLQVGRRARGSAEPQWGGEDLDSGLWRPQEGGCYKTAEPRPSSTLAGPAPATGTSMGRGGGAEPRMCL